MKVSVKVRCVRDISSLAGGVWKWQILWATPCGEIYTNIRPNFAYLVHIVHVKVSPYHFIKIKHNHNLVMKDKIGKTK